MFTKLIIKSNKSRNFSHKVYSICQPRFVAGFNLNMIHKIYKVIDTCEFGFLSSNDHIVIEFVDKYHKVYKNTSTEEYNELVQFLEMQKVENFNSPKE
jgi:hypothetical protein